MRSPQRLFLAVFSLSSLALAFSQAPASPSWYRGGPWETEPFSDNIAAYRAAADENRDPSANLGTMFLRECTDTFFADGSVETRTLLVYRIENEEGVKNWSNTEISWTPWRQDRPLLRVRIVNPNGQVIWLSEKDLMEVSGKEGDRVYEDRKTLKVPYPNVKVGSLIEEEVRIVGRPYLPGTGVQTRWSFDRGYSVGLGRYTVSAPASVPVRVKTSFDAKPQVSDTAGKRVQTWTFRDKPAAPDFDAFAPPEARQGYLVDVTTAPAWGKLAEIYGNEVERVLSSEAQALPAELKQQTGDVRAFVLSASRWINSRIRYTGLELGKNSILPFLPSTVISRGFGDCKDKATLLVALLRAAGYKAWVSLIAVGPGWDVNPEVTGLMDFDHAIVYVENGGFWFDPTVELNRTTVLPYYDQYRYTLVARPGSPGLERTPQARAEDNLVSETREIVMRDIGKGSVREVVEYSGAYDSHYRNGGLFQDPKEVEKSLTDYAQSYYGSRSVTVAKRTEPRDVSTLYGITVACDGISLANTGDSDASVTVHLNNLRSMLPDILLEDKIRERTADFRYNLPFAYRLILTVREPAGFRPRQLPDPVDVETPLFALHRTWKEEAGTVRSEVSFAIRKMQLTPAEFQSLRSDLRMYLNDQSAQTVQFDLEAEDLRAEGRYAEAFQKFRQLVEAQPGSAIQNKRLSVALMSYSLGQPAVHYALRATELDPQNAELWANLANMLANDGLGRRLNAGYDREGTIAAWRRAIALNPDEKLYPANLAIIYEYNAAGERYQDLDDLKRARTEYLGLGKALTEYNLAPNLWSVHIRLGEYDAAQSVVPAISDPIQRNIGGAVVQVLKGTKTPPAKLVDAGLTLDKRQTAWVGAADVLVDLRRYQDAARFLRQAAIANPNAASIENRADILDKIQAFDDGGAFSDSPTGVIQKFFFDYLGKTVPLETLFSRHFSSTFNSNLPLWGAKRLGEGLDQTVLRLLGKSSPRFLADFALSLVRFETTGDDTLGYRVVAGFDGTQGCEFYVVREKDGYRIVTWVPFYSMVGRQMLADLASGQTAKAARWYDWAFPPMGSPRPPRMSWNFFSDERLPRSPWVARLVATELSLMGAPRAETVKTATALWKQLADRGKFLAEARAQGLTADLAEDFWTALAFNLGDTSARNGAFAVARLAGDAIAPFAKGDGSFIPHYARWQALAGDTKAGEATIEAYRDTRPDDRQVFSDLLSVYQINLNFAKLEAEAAKYPSRLGANDLNNLAWDDLFRQPLAPPTPLAVERSRRSVSLSAGQPGERSALHTLATIYATAGRYDEALAVLNKALSFSPGSEPTRDDWYVAGLIADGYGFPDAAREAWLKVTPPEEGVFNRADTYLLAKARLDR